MRLIRPYYVIRTDLSNSVELLMSLEDAGRTCYKSEDTITKDSFRPFIEKIIRSGHESVIEHGMLSVRFVCDRGITHELVRHRLCSFSQESTRYCNYSKAKFNNELTFIIPKWTSINPGVYTDIDRMRSLFSIDDAETIWLESMFSAEQWYNTLIEHGWSPQQARDVLPISLKTEIVMSANFREWREIFRQRAASSAHPQMRELMCPLLAEVKEKIPIIFDDL